MKVCTACQSAAIQVVKNQLDECRRCGHTGLFRHLHQQTGNPSKGLYLGFGGYQNLRKSTEPN